MKPSSVASASSQKALRNASSVMSRPIRISMLRCATPIPLGAGQLQARCQPVKQTRANVLITNGQQPRSQQRRERLADERHVAGQSTTCRFNLQVVDL